MDLNLHRRQGEAFLSPAREILFGGGAGGGKSHLMRVAAIAWCYEISGLQVYLFRRVSPDLWKTHMEGPQGFPALLASWVDAGKVSINYSKGEITFANGSKIFLCHCQYEKDVYKYQGPEFHVLMVDELTHFSEFQYRYLRSRVRMAGVQLSERYQGLFPRVLASSNPGNIGHNWVKEMFVSPQPPMTIWQPEDVAFSRQFIPSLLTDNPSVNPEEYRKTLEGLGNPELVKAMLQGSWDIVAGGMFDDVWNPDIHVVEPFEIPKTWRIDRSFDWGSSKPFSVQWWAESDGTESDAGIVPRGTLFLANEWYGWNGKPNEGCRMLASEVAKGIVEREEEWGWRGRVKPGPADPSIFATENGMCIANDMLRLPDGSGGVSWERADNERKPGWERLRKLLKASLADHMEEPGLFVFNRCRHFIRTVPVLPRDERDPDDVDSDAEDHEGDAARYKAMANRRELAQVNIRLWKN